MRHFTSQIPNSPFALRAAIYEESNSDTYHKPARLILTNYKNGIPTDETNEELVSLRDIILEKLDDAGLRRTTETSYIKTPGLLSLSTIAHDAGSPPPIQTVTSSLISLGFAESRVTDTISKATTLENKMTLTLRQVIPNADDVQINDAVKALLEIPEIKRIQGARR